MEGDLLGRLLHRKIIKGKHFLAWWSFLPILAPLLKGEEEDFEEMEDGRGAEDTDQGQAAKTTTKGILKTQQIQRIDALRLSRGYRMVGEHTTLSRDRGALGTDQGQVSKVYNKGTLQTKSAPPAQWCGQVIKGTKSHNYSNAQSLSIGSQTVRTNRYS
eukprot:scaffold116920_cov24-Tisochrysis_lutea.AAC.1